MEESANERFWLEITDRDTPGYPLIAANEGESGNRIWHGEIIQHVMGLNQNFVAWFEPLHQFT